MLRNHKESAKEKKKKKGAGFKGDPVASHALGHVWLRYLERLDQVLNKVEVFLPECRVAEGAPRDGAGAPREVAARAGAVGTALAAVADARRRVRRAAAGRRGGSRRRVGGRARRVVGAVRPEDVHGLRVGLDLPQRDGDLVDGEEEGDRARDLPEEGADLGRDRRGRLRQRLLVEDQLRHRFLLHQGHGLARFGQRGRVAARRQHDLLVEPHHLPAPFDVLAQELAEPAAASAGARDGYVAPLLQEPGESLRGSEFIAVVVVAATGQGVAAGEFGQVFGNKVLDVGG
ncbi:hypothetical protein PG994_001430 [Apiospora phragmitis]|uniref:Uncharacterized protein n=1 Tax=Apiospora phragmitis TaxID=2905665 RepID=A0ABR1WTH7_9PEZI